MWKKGWVIIALCFVSSGSFAQSEPLEFYGASINTVSEGQTRYSLFGAHEDVRKGNLMSATAHMPLQEKKFWEVEYFGYFPESPFTGRSLEDHRARIGIGFSADWQGLILSHRSRLEYRSGQLGESVRYRPEVKVMKLIPVGETYRLPVYASYEVAYNTGDQRFDFGFMRAGVIIPLSKQFKAEMGYLEIRDFRSNRTDSGTAIVLHYSF